MTGECQTETNSLTPKLVVSDVVGHVAAGGAVDSKQSGSQSGLPENPEGDGIQEGPSSGLRGIWDSLQGTSDG